MSEPTEDALRFADILTTASAVANYLGESDVAPGHLLHAVALLRGAKTMEDLGRALSPLVRRPGRAGVTPEVREFTQRWFAALGGDANATLGADSVESFVAALRAMDGS